MNSRRKGRSLSKGKARIANARKVRYAIVAERNRIKKEFHLFAGGDFSAVENDPQGIKEIQELVGQAGRAAASEARAVGIPMVFVRGNSIIRQYADGRTEVIRTASDRRDGVYFRKLKSGILHARKK